MRFNPVLSTRFLTQNKDIIALLLLGCLFLALFIAWQLFLQAQHTLHALDTNSRYPPPLIPPALWTRSTYRLTAVMLVALLTWASFLGWNFWTQLYYQQYEGLSPVRAMLRMFPMCVAFSTLPSLFKTRLGSSRA